MGWLLSQKNPTFPAALRDVTAKSAPARLAAAQRLGQPEAGEKQTAIEALRRLIRDVNLEVRATALESLAQIGEAETISDLLICLNDAEATVQAAAVKALTELGGDKAKAPLEKALDSPHPEVRFQAVVGYAQLVGAEAAPAVLRLMKDADPEVRANATAAMGLIASSSQIDNIKEALKDPEMMVRWQAALALARRGERAAARVLREALDDPDAILEALDGIAAIRDLDAADAVAALAQGARKPWAVRAAAGKTLHQLGDPRGIDTLREVLTAWNSEARSYAVEIAGDLEITELAAELRNLARRPRDIDLEILEQALKRLSSRSPDAADGLTLLAAREGKK